MPEEQKPEVDKSIRDLLGDYDLGVDEGTGEMNFTKREVAPKEEELVVEDQKPLTVDDKFTAFDSRFNSLIEMQQKQSNAIQQLANFIIASTGKQNEQTLDQEQLGEVFTDPDKGAAFLNTLTSSIEKIVDSKLNGLQPLVQQQQIQAELQQLQATVPDLGEYAQGMHQLLGINPNLTFSQAYQLAKQYGWKTVSQKQQPTQPNNPNNVADINQRRSNLPNPTNSANASLKSKTVNSVKDALEAALEELGA